MVWTWTAQRWHRESEAGKSRRTREFDQIERAIASYNCRGQSTDERLASLKAILDAISAWRVFKQEEKGKFVRGFESPKADGKQIAAAESKLREAKMIGKNKTLSVRSGITDTLVRDVVAEIDDALALARTAWGGAVFTDVDWVEGTEAAPQHFRYLVSGQTESKEVPAYRQASVDNPRLIANAVISASVITEKGVHVWAPSGFILSAPKKCIGAAAARDVGTKNAVAWGHDLEKYREMLRIYLGEKGVPGVKAAVEPAGLKAPRVMQDSLVRNEAVVLGRSYGEATRVIGIFVLVDQVAATVDTIVPAKVARIVANVVLKGTTVTIPVVIEKLDSTSSRRMGQYRALNKNLGLPIIQIPTSVKPGAVKIAWNPSDLYGGRFCDFPIPANAVEHGSRDHRKLLSDLEANVAYFDGHDSKCNLCRQPNLWKMAKKAMIPNNANPQP
jgi:hypothetical protein